MAFPHVVLSYDWSLPLCCSSIVQVSVTYSPFCHHCWPGFGKLILKPRGLERGKSIPQRFTHTEDILMPLSISHLLDLSHYLQHDSSVNPYLCRGTMKRARTNFLLLAFVFIFIQKSIAAYKKREQTEFKSQHNFN